MEIFDNIVPILTTVTAWLIGYFDGPQGTLQALAIAGVVVILLIFVVARRQGQITRTSARANGEPVVLKDWVTKAELDGEGASFKSESDELGDALVLDAAKKELLSPVTEEKNQTDIDGFVFHRRKAKTTGSTAQFDDADPEVALAAIEQEI